MLTGLRYSNNFDDNWYTCSMDPGGIEIYYVNDDYYD